MLVAGVLSVAGCSLVPNMDAGTSACNNVSPRQVPAGKPTDAAGPLAGLDVASRPASELGARAHAAGFVVTFRLDYLTNGNNGYGECWCVPPTEGKVTDVDYGSNGEVIVFVRRDPLPGGRPQPGTGWGCSA